MSPAGQPAPVPAPTSWRIPRRLLLPSVVVGVGLLVPIVVAYLFAGPAPALVVGASYAAAVPLVTSGLAPARAAGLCVVAALVAAAATVLGPDPLPAAALVALLVMVSVPGSPLAGPGLAGLPAVAAVLVALPPGLPPVQTGLWTLFGSLALVLGLGAVRRDGGTGGERPAAEERSLVRAVFSALVVGTVVWGVLHFDVPHGHWAALTLILVLRRSPEETTRTARWRVAGTVLGAVVALLLAILLPPWGVAVALGLMLIGLVGYALAGNYPLQVACLTPLVILLGAAQGGVAQLVAERVAATIVGAVAAGAVGWLVLRLEGRAPAATGTGSSRPAGRPDVAE